LPKQKVLTQPLVDIEPLVGQDVGQLQRRRIYIEDQNYATVISNEEEYDTFLTRNGIQCLVTNVDKATAIYGYAGLEHNGKYKHGPPIAAPAKRKGSLHARVDIEPLVDVRQLLHIHGVEIDEDVLRTMNFRFSGAVLLALQQQNADLALDAYMSTKRLPGPSTQAQWESLGIVMVPKTLN